MQELKDDIKRVHEEIERESLFVQAITGEVGKVIVGQKYLVDRLMVGLLANGHVLIEGVPGLAKTYAVKTLAQAIATRFHRIQFTPDLLPADIVGTQIYNQRTGEFVCAQGPGLRQPRAGGRNQPRPAQSPERAARGDAGAAGDHRRGHVQARRPVPGARDPEPDRAGRHLPAARGADRPVPAEAAGRLPDRRKRRSRSSTG